LVVDLLSGEEDAFLDTLWVEEITRKLFSDLNHGLLGLPSDDNIIILNDSNEEEDEVREDDHADVEAAPSFVGDSSAQTTSAAADDDVLDRVQDDSNGGCTPDRV
jgi:hypothetical protein